MDQMALNIIGMMSEGKKKTIFKIYFGGDSVIVWPAISYRGSSELVFLEGK